MTKKSYVVENGLTLGLIGLAVLVVFAIGLPRWTYDNSSKRAIDLPQSLSGNYTAVTQAEVSANKVAGEISAATGASAATRIYSGAGQQNVLVVNAVRAPGAAALPITGSDVSKVGVDVCFSMQLAGQSGPIPVAVCRRSGPDLTVQVTSNVDAATAAKYADELWSSVH